jgi:hypothetical protein
MFACLSAQAMQRLCTMLLAAALAAASLAGGAAAGKVSWEEQAKNGGAPVMGFRVESLTFDAQGWNARVTFTNLSKRTVTIGANFGAAIFDDLRTQDLNRAIGFAVALRFSPARPKALAPGASWSGTIGGDGTLRSSPSVRYARLVFGPLGGLPGQKGPVFWVTDHALTLPPSLSGSRPNVI